MLFPFAVGPDNVILGRIAGMAHGRNNAATFVGDLLVAGTLQPPFEFVGAIAGKYQVRMAVDEGGGDATAAHLVDLGGYCARLARQLRERPGEGDQPILPRKCAIFDHAIGSASIAHRGQAAVHQ